MEDLFNFENVKTRKGPNDEMYDHIRKNCPDVKAKINPVFHHCSPYLDENYKKEFRKKDKFFERLWELWVCYLILESPFKESLLRNKDKKKGNDGPDFIIKNALNGKDLILECACPNYKEENITDTGKFQFTKEFRENGVLATWPDESYDELILSRYMNSFATKAEQLEKQKKTDSYAESYYVLCVSGVRLSWFKGKKYLNHHSHPTEGEFKKALKGLEWEWLTHTRLQSASSLNQSLYRIPLPLTSDGVSRFWCHGSV
ncbi:MAG: hypothetical protein K2X53_01880 [Alphaproteobacteria bacterium]|nr:hypothetical protein [Alphaproteobacteria bacterium]